MRSIANGSVEGFPDPSTVRTVFVEADILGTANDLPIEHTYIIHLWLLTRLTDNTMCVCIQVSYPISPAWTMSYKTRACPGAPERRS